MDKGYKVFNSDWTCRGFKFEVGETYHEDINPDCCHKGFHYCEIASDCFRYYNFDADNKVAEILAIGKIDKSTDDSKRCTDTITILREITWQELLTIVNTGKNCTGLGNSGDYNSGNYNSGTYNSGDYNSGNYNSGTYNSGYYNSGDRNSGNRNSGNYNSGNRNSGNRNSGGYNSGTYNSGTYNSGDRNSGNYNSGYYNSGDYNSGNYNSGCFNSENRKMVFFDKETKFTFSDWSGSEARKLLNKIKQDVVEWIGEFEMTDEEKNENPNYKTTGGFLKILDSSECSTIWWNDLSDAEKEIIRVLPNYDEKKFFTILGINA